MGLTGDGKDGDQSLIERFLRDPKEVAEHNMLVDLNAMTYQPFANKEVYKFKISGRLKVILTFTIWYQPSPVD